MNLFSSSLSTKDKVERRSLGRISDQVNKEEGDDSYSKTQNWNWNTTAEIPFKVTAEQEVKRGNSKGPIGSSNHSVVMYDAYGPFGYFEKKDDNDNDANIPPT